MLLAALAHAAERSPNATAIRALIEKLAISNAPASADPIFTPSKDTPSSDKRVIAHDAADQIRKYGLAAFPLLLNSVNDNRQSVAFRRVLPSTVGDACFCLITRQLYALPPDYSGSFYRKGADGKEHERPVFLKDLFTVANLKEWLDARQGRTLPELQLEALGWVLAEEENIGAPTPEAEKEYLAPLRAKHAALKKQVDATGHLPQRHEARKFWEPTKPERARSEDLARKYAARSIGLSEKQVAKMKTDFLGLYRAGKRQLLIQFYDPEVYQPLPGGHFEAMLGGFPSYFTVTVDPDSWTIIDHYASPK